MKSLNSFTDLPISKGLLLLVDNSTKEELEALMLTYIKAEDAKSVDVVPLMRFLYETMDIKGDDLKIAFCAVCSAKPDNFQSEIENEYYGQANFSAIEKKLFPLFERCYITKIKYISPRQLKKEEKDMEELFKNPAQLYKVSPIKGKN